MAEIAILIVRIDNATVQSRKPTSERRPVHTTLEEMLDLTATRKGYRDAMIASTWILCSCSCSIHFF
jgi:hypothetical protein